MNNLSVKVTVLHLPLTLTRKTDVNYSHNIVFVIAHNLLSREFMQRTSIIVNRSFIRVINPRSDNQIIKINLKIRKTS
jgi:hypothetical protein